MNNTCCKDAEVVENTALGKVFYVCRGCKSEITPDKPYQPQPLRIEDKPEDNPDAFDPFWGYVGNPSFSTTVYPTATTPTGCSAHIYFVTVTTTGQEFKCIRCGVVSS